MLGRARLGYTCLMLAPKIACGVALLLSLAGCALTDGHVHLNTSPQTSAASGGAGREVIVFPVHDEREEQTRCGVKRNGFGAETANVLCEPDPSQWLGELVLRGLDRAGFKVVTTQTAKTADPLRLRLGLKHLFIDQVNGALTVALVTDAHVVIQAQTETGLSAERSFFAKSENDVLAVLDSGLQASMDEAVEKLADGIVDALVGLNAKYPSAGSRVAVARRPSTELARLEVRP
ncbi:MAG: hypothetical protein EOO73_12025 [Myxococcales bacterium]|nr:MAG: hypothetical protein EOO73_12025 [Myxococcales bacterium]